MKIPPGKFKLSSKEFSEKKKQEHAEYQKARLSRIRRKFILAEAREKETYDELRAAYR